MLPLHQHCLFKIGVNLGEIWRLSELADWLRSNNRSRFLLTAPPLRLPGAVGSPATPPPGAVPRAAPSHFREERENNYAQGKRPITGQRHRDFYDRYRSPVERRNNSSGARSHRVRDADGLSGHSRNARLDTVPSVVPGYSRRGITIQPEQLVHVASQFLASAPGSGEARIRFASIRG